MSLHGALKARIKDTRAEPLLRWLVKRSRGIRMPLELVKNEIYDRQASEVMSRVLSTDSNCIDVGSHQGQYLREFMRYAPRGKHRAFEPIPYLAAQLRSEFACVEVFETALCDRSGEASFFVLPAQPARSGLHRRGFISPSQARHEIKVHTEKLDSLLPAGSRVDFIKLDVEGAEGAVIAGALQTIATNRPFLVFEHGGQSSADFGISSGEIYDALTQRCMLQLSRLPDWLSGMGTLSKSDFVRSSDWYFLAHPPR
jgi:FkbM family methyltransferase